MGVLGVLAPLIGDVIKGIFPNKEEEAKAQAMITAKLIEKQTELENAAAAVVQAEASSKHWLAANWRPILMLTFGGLIVARFLGWTAPGISEQEYLALWDIVQLGIGGYVIGRSAEKVLPQMASVFNKNR